MAVGALSMFLPPSPAGAAHDPAFDNNASNGQCWGNWHPGDHQFFILDNDRADSDYCYINFTWLRNGTDIGGGGRFNAQQDVGGWQGAYHDPPPSGATHVRWQVCKERQNDPDICSGWAVSPK